MVVTLGTGSGSGTGQGTGQGMSPEARATKQAENGMTGTSPNNENGLSVVDYQCTNRLSRKYKIR